MIPSRPDHATETRPGCLLLVPRGFRVPEALLEGLTRRGAQVHQATDAPAVMAELASARYRSLIVVEPRAVRDAAKLARAVARWHPDVRVWQCSATGQVSLEPFDTEAPEAPETSCGSPPAPSPEEDTGRGTPPSPPVDETAATGHPAPPADPHSLVDPPPSEPAPKRSVPFAQDRDGPPHEQRPFAELHQDDEDSPPSGMEREASQPLLTEEELAMLLEDTDLDEQPRAAR